MQCSFSCFFFCHPATLNHSFAHLFSNATTHFLQALFELSQLLSLPEHIFPQLTKLCYQSIFQNTLLISELSHSCQQIMIATHSCMSPNSTTLNCSKSSQKLSTLAENWKASNSTCRLLTECRYICNLNRRYNILLVNFFGPGWWWRVFMVDFLRPGRWCRISRWCCRTGWWIVQLTCGGVRWWWRHFWGIWCWWSGDGGDQGGKVDGIEMVWMIRWSVRWFGQIENRKVMRMGAEFCHQEMTYWFQIKVAQTPSHHQVANQSCTAPMTPSGGKSGLHSPPPWHHRVANQDYTAPMTPLSGKPGLHSPLPTIMQDDSRTRLFCPKNILGVQIHHREECFPGNGTVETCNWKGVWATLSAKRIPRRNFWDKLAIHGIPVCHSWKQQTEKNWKWPTRCKAHFLCSGCHPLWHSPAWRKTRPSNSSSKFGKLFNRSRIWTGHKKRTQPQICGTPSQMVVIHKGKKMQRSVSSKRLGCYPATLLRVYPWRRIVLDEFACQYSISNGRWYGSGGRYTGAGCPRSEVFAWTWRVRCWSWCNEWVIRIWKHDWEGW